MEKARSKCTEASQVCRLPILMDGACWALYLKTAETPASNVGGGFGRCSDILQLQLALRYNTGIDTATQAKDLRHKTQPHITLPALRDVPGIGCPTFGCT